MKDKTIFILGLTYFGKHDSSVVLLKNGEVVSASEEERWSRIKYDRSFPEKSIKYCLDSENITISDIDYVGFFWQPWKGIWKRLYYIIKNPYKSFIALDKNSNIFLDLISAKKIFRQKTGYKGPFYYINHHIAHVSSVFFSSGFKESALISIDGTGESETCWIGKTDGKKFIKYQSVKWPHSIGHTYSAITQYLGFKSFEDEYKVMGLASFGEPVYLEEFRNIIKSTGNGKFEIDLKYFDYQHGKSRKYSDEFVNKFGKNRLPNEPISQIYKNIASSLQTRLDEILTELTLYVKQKSNLNYLCLTGGVSLNSLATGKLRQKNIIENIYISPVSGDTGTSLGSAYFIDRIILGNKRDYYLPHSYFGPFFNDSYIENLLIKNKIIYKKIVNPAKEAAKLILENKIIGWFQGKSEFGQRALGNRSILASPKDIRIKDRIIKIKKREEFRPFAPSILEEFQKEYFYIDKDIPFMTEIHTVRKEKRNEIPAVVHIDGSARLQTVCKKTNPLFYELINEFYKLSRTPLVLNTSFNVKEPIVNTPEEALTTFLKSEINSLIIGNFLIDK